MKFYISRSVWVFMKGAGLKLRVSERWLMFAASTTMALRVIVGPLRKRLQENHIAMFGWIAVLPMQTGVVDFHMQRLSTWLRLLWIMVQLYWCGDLRVNGGIREDVSDMSRRGRHTRIF